MTTKNTILLKFLIDNKKMHAILSVLISSAILSADLTPSELNTL